MKIKFFFFSFLMSILFLAGCGGPQQEQSAAEKQGKTEIVFYTMQLSPTFDDYINDMISEFENTHPDIKIEWRDFPAQDYETKLLTSFMGESVPDVMNLTPLVIPKFIERDLLLPMGDLLTQERRDAYFQNVLYGAGEFNDKLYAVPWYLAAAVSMVNMDIFRKAGLTEEDIPKTFEEMYEVAEIIHEKTDKIPFYPIYTEQGTLMNYFVDADIPITNEEETKALFNTPRAEEVFEFWADFYKDGLAPSAAITAMHRQPIEAYKGGRLAIFHTGPQFLKHIKSDAPDVYESTVVRPRLHWEENKVYTIDVHVLSIARQSENPKLAAEFAAFVTNAENQLKLSKMTTVIPSVKKAVEDSYFTEVEDTPEGHAREISVDVIKQGKVVLPPRKHSGKLMRVLDHVSERVLTDQMTVKEALDYAEKQWNEILQEP